MVTTSTAVTTKKSTVAAAFEINNPPKKQKPLSNIVSHSFLPSINKLEESWNAVKDSTISHANTQLQFAVEVQNAVILAKSYDKPYSNEPHMDQLKNSLGSLTQDSSESVLSRWLKIAQVAAQLEHYCKKLPPYRDTMYEIAKAVNKGVDTNLLFADNGGINVDTSHRKAKEIIRLAIPKKASSKPSKPKSEPKSRITLIFDNDNKALLAKIDALVKEFKDKVEVNDSKNLLNI